MRQPGCVGRIVFAAHAHGNFRIKAGTLGIRRKKNIQSVVESVVHHLHRVVRCRSGYFGESGKER